MSSDITILEREDSSLELEIGAKSVGICIDIFDFTSSVTIYFDMKSTEDRKKLKELIWHLQHQIDIHEQTTTEFSCPVCGDSNFSCHHDEG